MSEKDRLLRTLFESSGKEHLMGTSKKFAI